MATVYKQLGDGGYNPGANAEQWYQVPSGKSHVISTLHIANVTSAPATFRVWLRAPGETSLQDWQLWAKDVTIAGNSIFSATQGITLAAGARVYISCTPEYSLNFHLFGSEVDV